MTLPLTPEDEILRQAKAIRAGRARDQRKAQAARKRERQPKVDHRRVVPSGRGQRQPRQVDREYKGCIAQLPCIATLVREGREAYGVHVAHVRHSYPHEGWRNPGLQRKPDDWRTLPLAPHVHMGEQHKMNEAAFYRGLGIYPPDLCAALKETFPNLEKAKTILRAHARVKPCL